MQVGAHLCADVWYVCAYLWWGVGVVVGGHASQMIVTMPWGSLTCAAHARLDRNHEACESLGGAGLGGLLVVASPVDQVEQAVMGGMPSQMIRL